MIRFFAAGAETFAVAQFAMVVVEVVAFEKGENGGFAGRGLAVGLEVVCLRKGAAVRDAEVFDAFADLFSGDSGEVGFPRQVA